jgi:hypothetical protein
LVRQRTSAIQASVAPAPPRKGSSARNEGTKPAARASPRWPRALGGTPVCIEIQITQMASAQTAEEQEL